MRLMRFRSVFVAMIAASVLLVALIATAVAHDDHIGGQWPTSCVDLNDIIEAHLGNHDNVGIYQRTFGAQAEQACRNDHREDVRSAFAWAIPTPAPTPAPQPPATQETAAPTVPNAEIRSHHYWSQVRDAALQRGAPQAEAERIADHVIELAITTNQGQALAFINGTLSTVAYGIKPPPTRTPTPAPLRRTVSGSGTSTKKVNLPAGIYDVRVEWRKNDDGFGADNFIVEIVGASWHRCSLLVNAIAISGSETHFCSLEGDVRIQVEASPSANWTIRFERD